MSGTIKKPYTKSKAVSKQCRNNGSCYWCRGARTYNNTKRLLATLFVILLIVSCGKRTTSNQSTYFKSDSLSVENSRILSQNIILNDIYTLEPFDSNKPMIIDGKYYYNAVIKYDKSKFENFKIDEREKTISNKSESGTSNKETKKTDNTILFLGMFFIVALFLFLWFKLKTPTS